MFPSSALIIYIYICYLLVSNSPSSKSSPTLGRPIIKPLIIFISGFIIGPCNALMLDPEIFKNSDIFSTTIVQYIIGIKTSYILKGESKCQAPSGVL
ncbi:MAG: hypothetical protein H6Q68_776 [Firmicutes bacterium]|nr:hypothetical protein [Bacillota bacterium]